MSQISPMRDELVNQAQRIFLANYSSGEFVHLGEITDAAELKQAISDSGNGLLRFLMGELSSAEDCSSPLVAMQRIGNIIAALNVIAAAMGVETQQEL